jgi:hypothetical protein
MAKRSDPHLTCYACGMTFRSMIAEARHRHNFPALCKRNKKFLAWSEERERLAKLKGSDHDGQSAND